MITKKFTASIAITSRTVVKFTTDTTVEPATISTDRVIGIYMGDTDSLIGDVVEILIIGHGYGLAGASIGRGTRLTVDASARLIPAVAGESIIAIAMESASALGLFEVIVIPSQF